MKEYIIQIAQAHAHIALEAFRQNGDHEPQGVLNSRMTQVLDLILEEYSAPAEWYQLYVDVFWQTYNEERQRL